VSSSSKTGIFLAVAMSCLLATIKTGISVSLKVGFMMMRYKRSATCGKLSLKIRKRGLWLLVDRVDNDNDSLGFSDTIEEDFSCVMVSWDIDDWDLYSFL
jgi:hypothetical protein